VRRFLSKAFLVGLVIGVIGLLADLTHPDDPLHSTGMLGWMFQVLVTALGITALAAVFYLVFLRPRRAT
jgi:Ca2+/Na+ antiporter